MKVSYGKLVRMFFTQLTVTRNHEVFAPFLVLIRTEGISTIENNKTKEVYYFEADILTGMSKCGHIFKSIGIINKNLPN